MNQNTNNTDNTQQYELPENVDCTKAFQFVDESIDGTIYTVENLSQYCVKVTWGKNDYALQSASAVKNHIDSGRWKVLKQPPAYGETFRFALTADADLKATYTRLSDSKAYIEWDFGLCGKIPIDVCKTCIENGTWTLLPSEPTPYESHPWNNIMSQLETMQGSVTNISCSAPVEPTLLEAIKAFTERTGCSVFIHEGAYEVFYGDDHSPARTTSDCVLKEIMKALELLISVTVDV